MKANNLPPLVLPDNPPSQDIINISQRPASTQEEKTESQPSTSKQPKQDSQTYIPKEKEKESSEDYETSEEGEEDARSQTEAPTLKPIKGKDLGLQIFFKTERTIPQTRLRH